MVDTGTGPSRLAAVRDRLRGHAAGRSFSMRRRDGADAYRDQEKARLLLECGWTQERIGERLRKSPQRVAQMLRFGRFISTDSRNQRQDTPESAIPSNLTERAFRNAWSKTW